MSVSRLAANRQVLSVAASCGPPIARVEFTGRSGELCRWLVPASQRQHGGDYGDWPFRPVMAVVAAAAVPGPNNAERLTDCVATPAWGQLGGFQDNRLDCSERDEMDRRGFLMQTGLAAMAASTGGVAGGSLWAGEDTSPTSESEIMRGFPPTLENQVTRESFQLSHDKMRWAMQHWRELFPTQRVSRGSATLVELPRKPRDIANLAFCDTAGQPTTLKDCFKRLDVDAFLVMKNGIIVFEDYFHGMTPETPHATFSMIKSIEATVIATLLDEGRLEESRCIVDYVPELAGSGYEGATIRQMLDMESGIEYDYGVGPESAISRHNQSTGPAARELGVPVGDYGFLPTLKKTRDHGNGMVYKESDPAALVWAAEKVTDRRFAALLTERIWSKIGAEFDADATCDQLGHWTIHLAVTLRDLARWGQMCLNDGKFNGRQVVPASFFADVRKNASSVKLAGAPLLGEFLPKGVGYRSFFYHHEQHGDAIAALGGYGQMCYVNPQYDAVIAFYSTTAPWAGLSGKGVRTLFCAAPVGPFREKSPDRVPRTLVTHHRVAAVQQQQLRNRPKTATWPLRALQSRLARFRCSRLSWTCYGKLASARARGLYGALVALADANTDGLLTRKPKPENSSGIEG